MQSFPFQHCSNNRNLYRAGVPAWPWLFYRTHAVVTGGALERKTLSWFCCSSQQVRLEWRLPFHTTLLCSLTGGLIWNLSCCAQRLMCKARNKWYPKAAIVYAGFNSLTKHRDTKTSMQYAAVWMCKLYSGQSLHVLLKSQDKILSLCILHCVHSM